MTSNGGDLKQHTVSILLVFCVLTLFMADEARAQTFMGTVTEDAFCDLPGTFCCNQCSMADPLDLAITGADPAASGDATITLEVYGDVNDLDEILVVTLEGFSLGTILNNNPGDDDFDHPTDQGTACEGSYLAQATVALSDLMPIIADGQIEMTLTPDQENNDIEGCEAPREYVTFTIEYPTGGVPTMPVVGLAILVAVLLVLVGYRLRRQRV
jgi:hypothetical protein